MTHHDRQLAVRSTAILRDITRPAYVLAWYCPLCADWVPPRSFALTTGTCRVCAHDLLGGA